jgi:hypothetical protein
MRRKQLTSFVIAAALVFMLTGLNANAQTATTTVFAAGFKAPVKIIFTPKGNLLVAEAGNGPNTGRISIVESTGNRRTLVDGLPSGFAPPNGDSSGPSGLAMRGRTLFVTIGAGDGTMVGQVPGTEVPNPNVSSPFVSSVLRLRLSVQAEDTTQGFTMTSSDHAALQTRGFSRLIDSLGNELLIEPVTNFRNFTENPTPAAPNAVRASNPFGIVLRGNILYVVDASQNLIWEVDPDTGDHRVFVSFLSRSNPLPIGPPFIDPVPDSIRLVGKSLLVPFLTGFPFPAGTADVRKIRLVNGASEPFIAGLSSAIDVLPGKSSSDEDQFFTLEFSTSMLMGAPGRLTRYDGLGAAPAVLLSNLVTPTNMVQDPVSKDLFITQIGPGLVVRVHLP